MIRFRHLSIRNFKVARFEFKNNELLLEPGKDADDFRKIVNHPSFPARHRNSIVEYPEESEAYAPKPIKATGEGAVLRNQMTTTELKSQQSEQPPAPDDGKNVTRGPTTSANNKGAKFS